MRFASSCFQVNLKMMALQRVVVAAVLVWKLLFQLETAVSLSSVSLPKKNSPTAADIEFDSWCDRHGIYRVGVQTVTTPRSKGGRGLFATRDMKKGCVVASIPAELVILEDQADDGSEWQVSLTTQVMALKNSNAWIQSWAASGPLPLEKILHKSDDDDDIVEEFMRSTVGQGIITRQGVLAALNDHTKSYIKRLEKLQQHDTTSKWYSLVLSRAAYLGKEWDYRVGAVPFFDMLNHCHSANDANTELVNFGACLGRKTSSNKENATEERQSTDISNVGLQPKDLLLVLTQDVIAGEELLTQYETNVEDSEEKQLKMLIQYGIPPP
jgi:SET domain